ncbi:uncharacterized protein C8Q71DRAFT_852019 [Rhodofomes roseus]|uniref:Uncharacterized protein n=1 Tax=Rhodofomes roseus TaxID=34475 RepID=A0ABQ8KW82_9APHY|nr:uncharacterized protein C8Q71DRAFT_852019 [Rhodofomes roseus]KAH9843481.1 hypothetical protein C8Q71DRAFT_852019 [Rhodofomes roseus]
MPYGSSSMHRADLIQVLLRNIPSRYTTHWHKKLVRYKEIKDDEENVSYLQLYFEDGSKAEADVPLSADRMKSNVRTCMYNIVHQHECPDNADCANCLHCSAVTPTWDGMVAYWTLVSTEKLRKVNPEHEAFRSTLFPMEIEGE